jgi:hypothetical protein
MVRQVPTTKRPILSEISRFFDSLELVAPVIVKDKVIMQELWKTNID